jgi:uncharacterized protein (TIGR00730 family)
MPVITFFGSGSIDNNDPVYKSAERLAGHFSSLGYDVATGAYQGVMEAVLKGASASGVQCIGVSTDFYAEKQVNQYVSQLIKTSDYFERLKTLIDISDAFIVMQGDSGTLLEMAAVWTIKVKDKNFNKPIVLFADEWDEILQTMAFYSEKVSDDYALFDIAESEEDVYEIINNHFKRES